MSNVKELYDYLGEKGLAIGGLSLGPKATPEGVAAEILRSLKAMEEGDFELIDIIGD